MTMLFDYLHTVTGEADSERSKVEELHASIESLAPLVAELKEKGGLDVGSVKRLVAELGRVESLQRELIDLRRLKSELMNENAALKAVSADADNIRAFHDAITASIEIDPRDPPATLARAIEVLRQLGPDITPEKAKSLSEMAASITGKIQTLEGERDKYRRQVDNLMRSGNGLTYPSCWTTPDGQTEYMFDITITDQGLIVSDATPTRANDPRSYCSRFTEGSWSVKAPSTLQPARYLSGANRKDAVSIRLCETEPHRRANHNI
jgi:hypothetical protein